MKSLLLYAATFATSFAVAAEAPRQGTMQFGDAARGREIANKWCVSCHSTGSTVDDRIPSFPALAMNLPRSEGAVRTFLMQPHKPMPPLELGTQQIEDIIVYLRAFAPTTRR